MNNCGHKKTAVLFFIFVSVSFLFAQTGGSAITDGLNFYAQSDWKQAVMSFKKAVSENESADAWYWLIMSEMSAGDYQGAIRDADLFLRSFPVDSHFADVQYQYGRALYQVQRYEESIVYLNRFYTANENSPLRSAALFWIAESLYDLGDIDSAKIIYTKIVTEYPQSSKVEASSYRMALIAQRDREEELLVLLKNTHEESLKMKEEYERRARDYEQTIVAYQKRIADLLKDTQISDLEKELGSEKVKNASLQEQVKILETKILALTAEKNELSTQAASAQKTELELLREKAKTVQNALDSEGGM